MTSNTLSVPLRVALAVAALLALATVGAATAVLAEAAKPQLSQSETVTGVVTVKSIDKATRHLVVTRASGETVSVRVPTDFRNFDQLKAGDKISATYTIEAEYAIAPAGAAAPKDEVTTMAARSVKGAMPGEAASNRIVVTGAVVGIDMAHHTLKLVSPDGGQVHTLNVKSAEGRKAMAGLKVGDKITATFTESLLIASHPA